MMNKFKQADSVISRPKPTVLSQNVFIHSFPHLMSTYYISGTVTCLRIQRGVKHSLCIKGVHNQVQNIIKRTDNCDAVMVEEKRGGLLH